MCAIYDVGVRCVCVCVFVPYILMRIRERMEWNGVCECVRACVRVHGSSGMRLATSPRCYGLEQDQAATCVLPNVLARARSNEEVCVCV